jgi:hypothetical protein
MILDTLKLLSSIFLWNILERNRIKPGRSVGYESLAAKIVSRRKRRCHPQRAKQRAVGIFGLLQLSEPWPCPELFDFFYGFRFKSFLKMIRSKVLNTSSSLAIFHITHRHQSP